MSENDVRELLVAELDAVRKRARRLCSHQEEVEDLVQETYLRALRSLGTFRLSESGPRSWLLTILQNLFCSRYKSRRRERQFIEDLAMNGLRISSASANDLSLKEFDLHWDDVDERLKKAVGALTPATRDTFLRSIEGMRCREIAAVIGVPIGTVMVRIHRARLSVAAHLNGYADEQHWVIRDRRRYRTQ